MADPRFHQNHGPYRVRELAALANATLSDGADPELVVADVAPLDDAGDGDVTFLSNRAYLDQLASSRAAACIIAPELAERAPKGMALILSPAPYMAYARIARAFYPPRPVRPGIHARAVVAESARIGRDCEIGPGAVIGEGAEIGDRCRVAANAVIDDGVVIGEDSVVGANAYVGYAIIGKRAYIYPGARIGQDGFGFAPDPAGHVRVPQLGRVVIGDDVEIGANSTIDRGAGPDTVIGSNCMIDNLVMIGHNVTLGRGCVLVAQVGVAGSTHIGDFVTIGRQAGLAGHLKIGSGVTIAAKAGVMNNISDGATVGGYPAVPIADWRRGVGPDPPHGEGKRAKEA